MTTWVEYNHFWGIVRVKHAWEKRKEIRVEGGVEFLQLEEERKKRF
jgi:hypothetical protein